MTAARRAPALVTVIIGTCLALALGIQSAHDPLLAAAWLVGPTALIGCLFMLPDLAAVISRFRRMTWWQVLSLLLVISSLVFRIRSAQDIDQNLVDSEAWFRIGVVAIVATTFLAYMMVGRLELIESLTTGLFGFLLVYLVTNICSAVWSVAPAWTLYRSLEFAVDVALIAIVSWRMRGLADVRHLFDWIWILNGCLLLSVYLGIAIAPHRALSPLSGAVGFGIKGVFPIISRNSVGEIAALLTIVALTRIVMAQPGTLGYVGLLGLALPLLLLSQTRSVLFPTAVAIVMVLFLARRFALLFVGGTIAAAALLFGNLLPVIIAYLERGVPTNEVTTLTGRTKGWTLAIDMLREVPLTGFGGYAGWRLAVGNASENVLNSAHNTYVEVLMGTSVWGLIPLVLLLGTVWYQLIRSALRCMRDPAVPKREWALTVEAGAILFLLTVRSFLSSTVLIWHPSFEFLMIVAYADYLRRQYRLADTAALADDTQSVPAPDAGDRHGVQRPAFY